MDEIQSEQIEVTDIPQVVFIDTSAIDPMYNNFSTMKEDFSFLKKWVDNYKVIIFTNEIVIREVANHIKKEASEKIDIIEKARDSRELAIIKTKGKYNKLFLTTNKEEIIKDTYNGFIKILKELKVKVLKNKKISIDKILDDYFNNRPPFGAKDKKHEFPDAIMLNSLIKETGKNKKIHIIARDGDWENVCKSNKNYLQYKYIKDFLNYLNKNNAIRNEVLRYISAIETQKIIVSKLNNILDSIEYLIDGQEYDRKGVVSGYEYDEVEITDISKIEYKIDTIENIDIEAITENINNYKITLTIICSVQITANCSYFDEENSIWDSEDKEYIDKIYGTAIEKHEVLLPLRLKIVGTNISSIINFNIENFEIIETDYQIFQLNNETLINRKYINNDLEDRWFNGSQFMVERIYKCPHCKKDIKVNLISGDTEYIGGNGREMGEENEYKVEVHGDCPYCNNSYLITGSVWEYPVLSFNYEQDIKIEKDE